MAKVKAPTHEVTHGSLYLRAGGEMKEVAVGTKLTLTPKQAKRMMENGFVRDLNEAEAIDVSDAELTAAKGEIETQKVKITDLQGKLEEATNELTGVKEANTDLNAKLEDANTQLAALKK